MSALDLIPAALRPWVVVLAVSLIAGVGAAGAWTVQGWRYGNELADRDSNAAKAAEKLAKANAEQLKKEQDQRLALEGRLAESEQTHYKALTDEKKARQLMLDRLATTELRLSVILASGSVATSVSSTTGAGGVDHGGARAELDPAHAQRIVGITGDGDDGLTALAACQGWARGVLSAGKALPP